MDLKTFLGQYRNPLVENVAATFMDEGKLHYLVSNNPAIPAAVSFLENDTYKGRPIFTNLPSDHWLMTYLRLKGPPATIVGKAAAKWKKEGIKKFEKYRNTYLLADREYTDVYGTNYGSSDADKRQAAVVTVPEFLQFRDVAAPLTGGLFAAAKAVAARGAPLANPKDRSPEEKVLQYYMLATFGLLSMCQKFAYKGLNNYVAAMVVGDDGKIVSAGVNVGSYKHAEVSTLLSYFSRTGHSQFPAKSIVFSTLCPCEQCIKYLQATRPPESVIYFSQMDTGESGKAGAEGGKSLELGKVTKPTQIALTKTDAVPNITQVTVSDPSRSEIVKHGVAERLGSCVVATKSNIAGQLGKIPKAVQTMGGAIAALEGKLAKDRTGTPADGIKEKVLLHIAEWLITAKL